VFLLSLAERLEMAAKVPVLPLCWILRNTFAEFEPKGKREMLTKPSGKTAVALAALVIILGLAALLPTFAPQVVFK